MRTINEAIEGAAAFGDLMRKLATSADEAKAAQEGLTVAAYAAQARAGENRAARRAREREERRAAKRQKASTR